MVPVFIVGIMGASLASCVLAVAAYSRDKLACEGRGVSGDRSLYLLCLLHVTEPLLSLFVPFMAVQPPLQISVAVWQWLMLPPSLSLPSSFTSVGIILTHLYHPGFLGPLFSPGGQREQQT